MSNGDEAFERALASAGRADAHLARIDERLAALESQRLNKHTEFLKKLRQEGRAHRRAVLAATQELLEADGEGVAPFEGRQRRRCGLLEAAGPRSGAPDRGAPRPVVGRRDTLGDRPSFAPSPRFAPKWPRRAMAIRAATCAW
jgi:hypothetical protein